MHVRRWETHLVPRQISADGDHITVIDSSNGTAVPQQSNATSSKSKDSKTAPHTDTFGDIAGEEKIDRGWLTTETVFQFKFVRDPFTLKQKLKNRLLYVKVSNYQFYIAIFSIV